MLPGLRDLLGDVAGDAVALAQGAGEGPLPGVQLVAGALMGDGEVVQVEAQAPPAAHAQAQAQAGEGIVYPAQASRLGALRGAQLVASPGSRWAREGRQMGAVASLVLHVLRGEGRAVRPHPVGRQQEAQAALAQVRRLLREHQIEPRLGRRLPSGGDLAGWRATPLPRGSRKTARPTVGPASRGRLCSLASALNSRTRERQASSVATADASRRRDWVPR